MDVWVVHYNDKKEICGDLQVFSTSEKAFEYLKWFLTDWYGPLSKEALAKYESLQKEYADDEDYFGISDFAWAEKVEIDYWFSSCF